MTISELNTELGNVDLFVLDQILKGRFENRKRLLDLGSGEGRNLTYFLKNGFEVSAIDQNVNALKLLRMYARTLGAKVQDIASDASTIPFEDKSFDSILAISILPFVRDFQKTVLEMHRILKADGICLIKSKFQSENELQADGLRLMTNEDLEWLANYWVFDEPARWEHEKGQQSEIKLVLRKN